ncbi:GGDEF domain-containing protein [Streptomyces mirabilis]
MDVMPLPYFEVDVPIRSADQPGLHGVHVFTGRADSRSAAVRLAQEVYDAARAAQEAGLEIPYGHAAGDAVIQTIGQRLTRWSASRQALASRLGGDEFAVSVVLPPATALAEITGLREQLQQPFQHEQHTLRLDVSLGIARAVDMPGEISSRILRGADTAMYKVKEGRETFPYLATRADAYADTVNGRRVGRRGTHLLARAA